MVYDLARSGIRDTGRGRKSAAWINLPVRRTQTGHITISVPQRRPDSSCKGRRSQSPNSSRRATALLNRIEPIPNSFCNQVRHTIRSSGQLSRSIQTARASECRINRTVAASTVIHLCRCSFRSREPLMLHPCSCVFAITGGAGFVVSMAVLMIDCPQGLCECGHVHVPESEVFTRGPPPQERVRTWLARSYDPGCRHDG